MKTYSLSISSSKSKSFLKTIKKLNRLCLTMNIETPILVDHGVKVLYCIGFNTNTGIYYKKATQTTELTEILKSKVDYEKLSSSEAIIFTQNVNTYEISLPEIKPNSEWSFLGIIDHTELLVKNAPNQQIPIEHIPSNLTDCNCEHCNKHVRRNKTIYVKNIESSKIMRVGGSCVEYYLGYDYEQTLEYLNLVFEIQMKTDDDCGDSEWNSYFSNKTPILSSVALAKFFLCYVKANGYISKKSAENNQNLTSTSILVTDFIMSLYDRRTELDTKTLEIYNNCDKCDIEIYNKLLQFIEEKYIDNNFLFNVNKMLTYDVVAINNISYIIGACSMFYGMYLANNKLKSKSEYIGTLNEKYSFDKVTLNDIKHFETQFGSSSIYTFSDEAGNIIIKFGTLSEKYSTTNIVEIGRLFSFNSEITKHELYRDIKQTTIGRLSKFKK